MKKIIQKFNAGLLAAFLALAPGVVSAQTIGPPPPGAQANFTAIVNPSVSNDNTQGYVVGSLWQNANTGQLFMARSVATGAAAWLPVGLPSTHPGYIASRWYVPAGLDGVIATGAATTAQKIFFTPGFIKQRLTINALGFYINTGSAGGNCQVAIYANNPVSNNPTGTAIVSSASISTTSTGSVNATTVTGGGSISQQLEDGFYWFASNCDNSTVVISGPSVTSPAGASLLGATVQGSSLLGGQAVTGYNTTCGGTCTFGTWPDVTSNTFGTTTTAQSVFVQFKVASVP